MFTLNFHYEDVSRQDPLLKPNHANVMEVPGSCKIRVVPKAAPSDFIIKNGKLAMEIPCGQKLIQTQRASTGKEFRSNPFLGKNKEKKGYVSDLARQSTLRGHGMSHFLVRISAVMSLLDFPVEIREKSIQFLMEMEFCEFSPELEDHFEIFEHIRGFNVTIVTSANTQDETLPPWSGFFQKDEGESHRFNGLGLHILYLKKRVKLEGFSSEGQVRSGFPVWFLRKQISISEFRRTIYNPGLAEINEFSWFPPANRASSVMESPGRTTGKDYGRGQTNPGTPQVDTVGVADPIETKTKPEADPDAYLGGAASLRVACHPFSPFSLLRSPHKGAGWSGALGRRGPEMDLDDGKKRSSSLAPMLGESVNGKLLAISEAQGSRRKKARQKEGRPRNDVVRLAAAEAIDLARDAPKKPSPRRPRRPWGNRTREEERKELRLQFRKGRLFPAAEAAYDRLFQNQCEYRRIGDFVAQSMHWSLLVLKTGGQASTEVGILIHITVSKTVFFIPSDGLRGIPKPPELLPVPVSLNRSGYPRIIPLIAG
ncbi:hypothetical protein L2E82_52145 [Cichorium intybus]|nr:hypothetical protein L2E82_52145 [Cichorium intybus]